jgi:hypothetical protein
MGLTKVNSMQNNKSLDICHWTKVPIAISCYCKHYYPSVNFHHEKANVTYTICSADNKCIWPVI